MSEIIVKYEMDPEHEKLLREIHSMLHDLNKSRRTPLSDMIISSKNLREELGISAKTEYTLRKKGVLKGKKIGSRWYYKVSDIINLPGDSDNSDDIKE
jgi:hypothetical protein